MTKSMRYSSGFTLMEVLMAMCILAVGILGLASLQATSQKLSYDSAVRSQATNMAYSIIDAMRVNRTQAFAGNYDSNCRNKIQTSCQANTSGVSLTESDLAGLECDAWQRALACALPQGSGNVTTGTPIAHGGTNITATITVVVQWDTSRQQTAKEVATGQTSIGTVTVVTAL